MSIIVDTSALVAVMAKDDPWHDAALDGWRALMTGNEVLFTTNYLVVELCAVLQRQGGMTAVRLAVREILPPLQVLWVDNATHAAAQDASLSANRRALSLVDCVSFAVMRREGIATAFTLDSHFTEHGFDVLPDLHGADSC